MTPTVRDFGLAEWINLEILRKYCFARDRRARCLTLMIGLGRQCGISRVDQICLLRRHLSSTQVKESTGQPLTLSSQAEKEKQINVQASLANLR